MDKLQPEGLNKLLLEILKKTNRLQSPLIELKSERLFWEQSK